MRIGVDLGGTKTEIICLNDSNGKEIYRHRVPSPTNDYKATVDNITKMVLMAEETVGEKGTVGVGIPGTVSKTTGNVKNAQSVWLNGNPLDQDLALSLDREVRVENDANCFAVSEATDGAASGKHSVFAVIVGTGCGAGIAIDGKPLSGINGIGGEWGHNPLPMPKTYMADTKENYQLFDEGEDKSSIINPTYAHKPSPTFFTDDPKLNEYPGMQCYCGKRGCLETWISGPSFKRDYTRVTGKELTTHDIIAAANKGDEDATAALYRYADRLARGLSTVINILDPDVIVLGGGMSNVNALYTLVPELWHSYIFSDTVETHIVPPRFGDSSGVRGAAWLWND